jgi:hypothetical protein
MTARRRARGALLAVVTGGLVAGSAAPATGAPRPPRPILAPEGTQPGGLGGGTPPADIASKCSSCHSGGSDDDGKTFRPWSTWSGTMMANATRDPLFAAALALSEQDAPGSGAYCLRCHTPKGFVNGRATGTGAALDANDHQGVDCEACHRSIDASVAQPAVDHQGAAIAALAARDAQAPHIGNARLHWDPRDIRHGPRDDADSPAHAASKTTFTSSSEMCGQCHEVLSPLTNLLDSAGNDTGFPFPLDNTYSEWRFSDFARAGTLKSCIDCHMPAARGDALTVSTFSSAVPRANPRMHLFVGGNEWGIDAVKLAAPEIATERTGSFDAAKEATRALLATAVKIDLQPGAARMGATTFDLTVRVTNLSGHKFPTGYADGRRAFLQVEVHDVQGQSLGLLGRYDEANARIDTASKLRVWESIQAEYASHKEWHIAKNDSIVEDTRIPPQGFRPEGAAVIAMTAPVGADYGPATGMRHYDDVPVRFTSLAPLPSGTIRVTARVFYQSTMREFIEELARANITNNRGTQLMAIWEQTGRAAPRLIASESTDVAVGPPTGSGGAGGAGGSGVAGGGGAAGSPGGGGSNGGSDSGCGCAVADRHAAGTAFTLSLATILVRRRRSRRHSL